MANSHKEIVNFIWGICNLLRGPYKRNEYRKVILPLTVLRRFDLALAPTKAKVLEVFPQLKGKSDPIIMARLKTITKVPFYNLSRMTFQSLLDDPNNLAPNLNSYINAFSPNIRNIFERFEFGIQVNKMAEKNLLYQVLKKFASNEIDLSPQTVSNMEMGRVFEELIRIGAEQANEEAGEHFTPREVIRLMVNLLLAPEAGLRRSHVVKTIYDPACGTGGMLSTAEEYIKSLNNEAMPQLYGQDWNDDAYAVCLSDMLIKGENGDNIKQGCTFEHDGFHNMKFDYMLANPPFGVEWKQQEHFIKSEAERLGFDGRFGAGLPRINDGALLFLQHMISKMVPAEKGGSRLGIVFNGSPLFTGDAGSGESNIRQWIIENDWLEAIVALPDQLFYNTGISTYIWILTNRKVTQRKGKIQLIDARNFWNKMPKSLGNKRHLLGDEFNEERKEYPHIQQITQIYGEFQDNQIFTTECDGKPWTGIVSKIFDNEYFGYRKITVERPLRLNFAATLERIARIEEITAFQKLASSTKKNPKQHSEEIEAGKKRQEEIRTFLRDLGKATGETIYQDRKEFLTQMKSLDKASGIRLSAPELKAILSALGERDETAEICRDAKGNPEPDAELRDTENVPLTQDYHDYFAVEVLPHVPDAWIDESKTKIGYEIPLNRLFYQYTPPRDLTVIEEEIKKLEEKILALLEGK